MDITVCLLKTPWRTLAALAQVYHVTAHHHRPKEQVAQELGAAIRAWLSQTLDALGPEARAALRALTQADDLTIPRADFIARFGALHPYRPWNPDAPPAPWPDPPSPAAALVRYGLAYPLNLGSGERPLPVVLLPHDLHAAIEARLDRPIALPGPPTAPPAKDRHVYRLDADVFTLLSFLNRRDYAARHGRWLPPRALEALNEHLLPPDDLGAGRSELQAARIPFLHYLAERVGLIAMIGIYLKPTLLAEQWLARSREERLRALWEAWREPTEENRALWDRYRLPGLAEDDDPVARFRALLKALTACPVGPLGSVGDLLDALAERDPALLRPQATYAAWAALDPEEHTEFETRACAVLLDLLTGPLTWFGVLEWAHGEWPKEREDKSASLLPCSSAPQLLTPLGAALLGHDDGVWPQDPAPAPLRVAPILEKVDDGPSAVRVDAPAGFPPADRFALEGIAPPDPDSPGRYSLTRGRFHQALQRGHTGEGIVNFLERASGEPLPAPVLGALYRWEEDLDQVAIRQALVLQTRDPDLLRELTGQRRVRETLGRTLNDRTVEVRADRLDALLRRLEWRGITPRLDLTPLRLPSTGSGQAPPARGEREALQPLPALEEGERAAIAAALRVYAHLADELGLSTRPAHALAQRWSQSLPLHLRDGVERAVEQTLAALHRAAPLEMEDRLPEPTGPLLGSLETAIQEQATVEIDYYTAGRAHRTTRSVDPLRLEWRGNVVYLIAYCHLRQDERVFRVDRIGRMSTTAVGANVDRSGRGE
ncbi:MAG: WYL domain-containing protein [Anaerolineae bacterium]